MSVTAGLHPLAAEHLPYFITAPGGFDQMLYVVAGVLAIGVLLLGGFYFWLHSLPDRIAHKRRRTQMELVAVLGLIGLFTHNNLFWIAALLLAMIELPVISSPIGRIADSLEKLSGIVPGKGSDTATATTAPAKDEVPTAKPETRPTTPKQEGEQNV